nr:hypothetical protein [Mesorhizobium sp.]
MISICRYPHDEESWQARSDHAPGIIREQAAGAANGNAAWRDNPSQLPKSRPERFNDDCRGRVAPVALGGIETKSPSAIGSRPGLCPDQSYLRLALILLVLPILVVIAHSFWTQNYLTIDHTFTLENYRIALTEPIYRDLLWRSLYISLTVSLLTVALAYPIAYFISFHGGRHKSPWLFLITIPFELPAARDVVEGDPRL